MRNTNLIVPEGGQKEVALASLEEVMAKGHEKGGGDGVGDLGGVERSRLNRRVYDSKAEVGQISNTP